MGDPTKIDELKPEDQACVRSTRTRVGRTVRGFAMANKLTREVREMNGLKKIYISILKFFN